MLCRSGDCNHGLRGSNSKMELVGENIDLVWEEFSAPLEDTFFVFETPIDQQGTRLNYIESQI